MSIHTEHTAFLFPGQGSQTVGMGRTLAEHEPAAAEVFQQADDILEYGLSKLCWEGPVEKLNDTVHTQPALLTHSIAVLRAFSNRFPDFSPAYTAGHSLGEYSALVASNALTFPDALRLVQERGVAMKEAGKQNPGGMAAVLGKDLPEVEAICQQASDETGTGVWLANDNCPGQVVISGDDKALSHAMELLKAAGARKVVRLAVSIAAHTPRMNHGQTRFDRALNSVPIDDPTVPIIGNVDATPLQSAPDIRDDLSRQLTSRVRWTATIRIMIDHGVTNFIEMGSKAVLSGLLRRIDRSLKGFALDDPTSFSTVDIAL
jgi:[acyl-carrier-protein] S-malonyltransferase